MDKNETVENVKDYYGKIISSTSDLQTSACCTSESLPDHVKEILKDVHDEVMIKFYGCGSPIPFLDLKDKTVLDLGSGSGRDVYVLSKLVGENGKVIGVDMTDEQLEVARRHQDYHAKKFGFKKSNVIFHKGYIENLKELGIEDNSIDLIVSNCVINLSSEKEKVFKEIFRVLKPGGELYFSDVFSDRRIPKHIADDKVIYGECLGGAMYIEDFRRTMMRNNCLDFRTLTKSTIEITNKEIKNKLNNTNFYSITVRAFKLNLEDKCEDFGQVAYYLGTIPECPTMFALDDHHIFEKNKPMLVCGNTADMISKTHYQKHFKVIGDKTHHFGLFDCGPDKINTNTEVSGCVAGACC